ncbi:MAG: hypothetical protein KF718_32025 [Polyangiaceae bacterium]|nr:hypothetical protein [Polyangiaceae bacterium]
MATTTAGRRRARSAPPAEPLPVVSGRFWIAGTFVAAMVLIPFSPLGAWLTPKAPQPHDLGQWQEGNTSNVRLTLITADASLLFCASDQSVDGAKCAFRTEAEQWPVDPAAALDDNKKNVIQPYRTFPDNKLILVAGLWAEPNMALRNHREPSAGVQSTKLARFIASCDVKFVGKLDAPKLRWNPGGPWQSEGAAMVARPVNCALAQE